MITTIPSKSELSSNIIYSDIDSSLISNTYLIDNITTTYNMITTIPFKSELNLTEIDYINYLNNIIKNNNNINNKDNIIANIQKELINNNLDKYIDKIKINYNNFEMFLNQGKNNYFVLLKFIHEGNYKIKLSITYYIRHKEIEDYIEYKEESILDYHVINPFSCKNEISANNFITIENNNIWNNKNINKEEEEKRIYLTNNKIGMNIILFNKIEEDIQIKDIKFEEKKSSPIKYINSYLNDLIHIYDLDEEEKKEMLIIKTNSSYNIPFETEFKKAINGSIGKINIFWTTKEIENFEDGKLNLLNKDEFEFPEIEVKPIDLEYSYKTEMSENNEILLNINIKNISNKSKQIVINIENNNEKYENNFIIIGFSQQIYLIKERETININLTLIPTGRGVLYYPYIKIVEKDLLKEKTYTNYYLAEKTETI
jgi:hypothetical protein